MAGAAKPEIADLAREVFAAHARRDKISTDILDGAANTLAKDACACAGNSPANRSKPVRFLLAGSVLLKQPKFAAKVAKAIRSRRSGSQVVPLKTKAPPARSSWHATWPNARHQTRSQLRSAKRPPSLFPSWHSLARRPPSSGIRAR